MDKKKLLTWGAIGLGVLAVGYVLYRVYQSQQGSTPSPAQLDQYAAAVLPGTGGSAGFDNSGVPAGSPPPQLTNVPPGPIPKPGGGGFNLEGSGGPGPTPAATGSGTLANDVGSLAKEQALLLHTIIPPQPGTPNTVNLPVPVAFGAGAPVGGQVALNRINSTNFQTARGIPAPAIRFG